MSVARLARDVLPQPWLLHHLIKHVAPRVRAEADRELQPLARTVIERRKLKRDAQPCCVMSTWAHWDEQFNAAEYGSDHGCPGRCVTLRAGFALPTCAYHLRQWLQLVGVEWAAKRLGIVPFAGVARSGHVTFCWPAAPSRPPRMHSNAHGSGGIELTAEQAFVLADAIADTGREQSAEMVRSFGDLAVRLADYDRELRASGSPAW